MAKYQRAINPQHFSAVGKRMRPFDMERGHYPNDETRECIERLAIEIFTDCANAGCTFQQSLAAILNSGMEWAVSSRNKDHQS